MTAHLHLSLAALLLALPAASQSTNTPWPTTKWSVSSPEEQGIDAAALEQSSRFIQENCPTRLSLLVVRHGKLVFERYYNGGAANHANNIMSMSKSILSVLTGIALEEGRLRSIDQKLDEIFPEWFVRGDDSRKHDITLAHLLTMTAGFEWQENTAASSAVFAKRDWPRSVLALPLKNAPGTMFNYNSGLSHMISCILARKYGMSTRAFADSRLFSPLGIRCTRWGRDPQGNCIGGWNVWMNARDLAKFGLLFLRQGRWGDRTIVSPEWLRTSSVVHVRTLSPLRGLGDYGYYWWKKTLVGRDVTLASGYGGQYVFLVPELDLMVVTTARSDLPPPVASSAQPYEMMVRFIIPAVRPAPEAPQADD